MAEKTTNLGEGTAQPQRLQPALLPDYFQLDERRLEDWIALARRLATHIRYVDFSNRDNGNWTAFLGEAAAIPPAEIRSFLADPERFVHAPQKQAWLTRPHFALFLVFLELLELETREINRFTQRHLDHFYREILDIKPKPAEPDQVHILFDLARGAHEQRVESGALLIASKNPEGKPRYVRTEAEVIVNRAKIGEVKVFFQEQSYRGLEEMYQVHLKLHPSDRTGAIQELLLFVLPKQRFSSGINPAFDQLVVQKNWDFLIKTVEGILIFPSKNMGLSLPESRRLMGLIKKQRNDLKADWKIVNNLLKKAGGNSGLNFPIRENFIENFRLALGFSPFADRPQLYDVLQNVENIFELHDLVQDGSAGSALTSLIGQNFHLSIADFDEMMTAFARIRRDWSAINGYIRRVAIKNNSLANTNWPEWPDVGTISLPNNTDSSIQIRLSAAGFGQYPGLSQNIGNFNDFWGEIEYLERFFNLSAEEILFVIDELTKPIDKAIDLNRLLNLLQKSYGSKVVFDKAIAFEAKYHLESNAASSSINRFKLLEQTFGLWNEAGKYYVLPPYPITNTAQQETLKVFLSLTADWNGRTDTENKQTNSENAAKKAQARRYLENIFYLRVNEFDAFLAFFQPTFQPIGVDPWNPLYRLVAEAQLRRDKTDLRPRQVVHQGFYAANDAALLHTERPGESHPRWRTFGRMQEDRDVALKTPPVQAAEFGLVIESPLLAMAAGRRIISLEMAFDKPISMQDCNKIRQYIEFRVSSPDEPSGYMTPSERAIISPILNGERLELSLQFYEDKPAIAAPGAVSSGMKYPTLKFVVKPETPINLVNWLSAWVIRDIILYVDVQKVYPDEVANDAGTIKPQAPFEPFGLHPRVGSRFSFRHKEAFGKPLSILSVDFMWMNKPNFTSLYGNYGLPASMTDASFTAQVSGGPVIPLFSADLVPIRGFKVANGAPFVMELRNPDFKHDLYLQLLSNPNGFTTVVKKGTVQTTVDTQGEATSIVTGDEVTTTVKPPPAPPYTPRSKAFTVSYQTESISVQPKIDAPHRAWQLHPFGVAMPEANQALRLVPVWPQEAELYIGLEQIAPQQSVNILFQVAEGSADPALERWPVEWQYLNADGWRIADERTGQPLLLDDPTDGLTRSGVLRFSLPADAANDNPLLPLGKHWLRATILEHKRSVCDLIGIHTQAVRAQRVLETDSADDPGQALPPDTVQGLLQRLPGIKTAAQPYSSFGGRSAEGDETYYRRVAERLRHKQRALSAWDVEHLLLEQFPELYRVKCLSVDQQTYDTQVPPGQVEVIVLPNLRGRLPQDPLQPRLPLADLDRMSAWLQTLGPEAAHYRLRNARFLPLQVEARLRLRPGYEAAYYLQQLNAELTRYLSPWAFDDNADIRFGGTVYVGQILNFIEERLYVDYITDLRLRWWDEAGKMSVADESVTAHRPDVVWVSAEKHILQLAESFIPSRPHRGIGEMAVELDFMVDYSLNF